MHNPNISITSILQRTPAAGAMVRGSSAYPSVRGSVRFYKVKSGTVVMAQIIGLPKSRNVCGGNFFGFHIHEGSDCGGNEADSFANAGMHLNFGNCPHPSHIGDMPPLLGADGTAFSVFLTNRFTTREIIGRTVVIHSGSDDFRTQPGGDSGIKIACGVITEL